jgi:hypothetical protein
LRDFSGLRRVEVWMEHNDTVETQADLDCRLREVVGEEVAVTFCRMVHEVYDESEIKAKGDQAGW